MTCLGAFRPFKPAFINGKSYQNQSLQAASLTPLSQRTGVFTRTVSGNELGRCYLSVLPMDPAEIDYRRLVVLMCLKLLHDKLNIAPVLGKFGRSYGQIACYRAEAVEVDPITA